jgi:hypothetical protein
MRREILAGQRVEQKSFSRSIHGGRVQRDGVGRLHRAHPERPRVAIEAP